MNPQLLFGVQFTLSLIIFAMVAKWYIAPALSKLPMQAALVPLFLVHALRYLPSSAFAPGQVDPKIPMDAMAGIAYGDLASAISRFDRGRVSTLRMVWRGRRRLGSERCDKS